MENLMIIDERTVFNKNFRIYGNFENPLFLAKDVAEWIEHTDVSTMVRNLDDEEKLIQTIFVSDQRRDVLMLTEEGLYEVLMQSRKPIAKQFKKKVKEILKDVRRHGMYVKDELLDNPDLLLDVITKYKEEREKTKLLEEQIQQDKPKVLFAESVESSEGSCLVGELAKILKQNGIDIGQNKLFDWLRSNGYLIKQKGENFNLPTQYSMELKLMTVKKSTVNNADGTIRTTRTTKITGKGQIYFVNKFLENKTA